MLVFFFVSVFFFSKNVFKVQEVLRNDALENISENRARQWRNDRMLLTLPFPSDRQTKKMDRDRHTDEQTYIKTHRQTCVGTETRQDGQDRNRDKRQRTTDENQETGRETRTVVRYGVHCDLWCCDGGWLVVVVVVVVVLSCCVLLVVLCFLFVLFACVLLGPFEWSSSPSSSSLEVTVCHLLPGSGGDPSPQVTEGAQDTRSNTGGQHWARWSKTCVFNVYLHVQLN